MFNMLMIKGTFIEMDCFFTCTMAQIFLLYDINYIPTLQPKISSVLMLNHSPMYDVYSNQYIESINCYQFVSKMVQSSINSKGMKLIHSV